MNLFLSPPGYGHPGPEVEFLNTLLRSELAAVEAYTQALGRLAGHPCQAEFRRIRDEHQRAANILRDQVHNLGGEADDAPSGEDVFAPLGPATVAVEAVVTALREREERGLAQCEAFLQTDEMPEECRFAVRADVLPRCHEHIDALAALAPAAKPKG